MRLRSRHERVTVSPDRHPDELVFEPTEDGVFFEGEVPDAVGAFLVNTVPGDFQRIDEPASPEVAAPPAEPPAAAPGPSPDPPGPTIEVTATGPGPDASGQPKGDDGPSDDDSKADGEARTGTRGKRK